MSGEKPQSNEVLVSQSTVMVPKKKKFTPPKISKNQLIVLAAVLLVAALYFAYLIVLNNNTALQIGSTRISKTEYKQLINEAAKEKVSTAVAKQTIITAYKDKLAAAKVGLVVSDNTQRETASQKHNVPDPSKLNQWQLLSSYPAAEQGALLLYKNGGYQGVAYYFPFSRYIESTVTPPSSTHIGDAAAIGDDQKYSQQQAASYRQKLMNGSISSAAAVKQIVANPRFDYGGSSNDSGNFTFDTNGYIYIIGSQVTQSNDTLLSIVKSLKPGQFSSVKTLQLSFGLSPLPQYNQGPVDAAYYFVQLTAANKAHPEVQKEFDKAVQALRVVDHV